MKPAGIVLIIVGILALAYQGYSSYEAKQHAHMETFYIDGVATDKIDVGPKASLIPLFVGGGCVVVGGVLLVLGCRKDPSQG